MLVVGLKESFSLGPKTCSFFFSSSKSHHIGFDRNSTYKFLVSYLQEFKVLECLVMLIELYVGS